MAPKRPWKRKFSSRYVPRTKSVSFGQSGPELEMAPKRPWKRKFSSRYMPGTKSVACNLDHRLPGHLWGETSEARSSAGVHRLEFRCWVKLDNRVRGSRWFRDVLGSGSSRPATCRGQNLLHVTWITDFPATYGERWLALRHRLPRHAALQVFIASSSAAG
ncbi:hypothetical protein TREMEDRAFT_62090 [Tremella mesenterica DSM 1558]|uniref:uncharacterized protein n=1 Tax=Tremella mesenterica (strain ATCC 24925 / CBS 8224 / DSM 1558 / NBRC 9311 / NRRL Y-6157 / RJB 2259-6 / UBC 559-6) TaxID=578456 RepID=UPI0003F494E8|nr:uncharacterized protein TREMEDRAFT_62090 [Tremella mesenterica DSM 1558]EIW69239.1 hypothetical protein TREMEDRAFT_62090 [Tremella mesenterica DSM 1558]